MPVTSLSSSDTRAGRKLADIDVSTDRGFSDLQGNTRLNSASLKNKSRIDFQFLVLAWVIAKTLQKKAKSYY